MSIPRVIAWMVPIVAGHLFFTSSGQAEIEFIPFSSDGKTSVLFVSGDFDRHDPAPAFLRAVASHKPDIVTFNSPGGNVYSAMSLGRAIRAESIDTIQLRAFECSSACAFAFVGGARRLAEPGSIGVHRSSFDESFNFETKQAVSAVQVVTADILQYLGEMGIDPAVLEISLRYDSWDVRYLSGSEMAELRVTTVDAFQANPDVGDSFRKAPRALEDKQLAARQLPVARSGVVRHPVGQIELLSQPNRRSNAVGVLTNHRRVSILNSENRWFRVRSGSTQGYVHHTWIKVDQYMDHGFDSKFVQIKSFQSENEAVAYVRSSVIPVAAILASNGWYAITLDGVFSDQRAAELLSDLKSRGHIPPDSFKTYGNTYVEKVCCN